jgi:hypothetical protein
VTTVATQSAVAPLDPIIATLATFAARHGKESLQGLVPGLITGDLAPARGWIPGSDLLSGAGVTRLLDASAERWGAQAPAAAALAWKCYSYWVALPAVVGYATARRVPLMTPGRIVVRYTGTQPFIKIALHEPVVAVLAGDPITASGAPGILVVPDEAALLRMLKLSLVDGHLSPMADRIREQVNLGRRTLWGSLASGVSYGLSRAADMIPGSTLETAGTVLDALDATGLVDLTPRPEGGLDIQRRTCCLAFTLPNPKICTTCCIRNP